MRRALCPPTCSIMSALSTCAPLGIDVLAMLESFDALAGRIVHRSRLLSPLPSRTRRTRTNFTRRTAPPSAFTLQRQIAVSHVRKMLSASVFSISGFSARSPSDLTPFSTAGSHRQVSDSGTEMNRFPVCCATNDGQLVSCAVREFFSRQCQLKSDRAQNRVSFADGLHRMRIPIRSAPVPLMWIQCLRWRSRLLRFVQQRRTCWPLWGRGTCVSDPNSTHSDLPFPLSLAPARSRATHATWPRTVHLPASLQCLVSQITEPNLSCNGSPPRQSRTRSFSGRAVWQLSRATLARRVTSSAKSHLLHREMRRRTLITTTPSS